MPTYFSPKIHSRRTPHKVKEESLLKNPGVQYVLFFVILMLIIFIYHFFFHKETLKEEVRTRKITRFKAEKLPELKVDGNQVLNRKLDAGFKSVRVKNGFQQRKLMVLRKYESTRFVGVKERELWLKKIERRNSANFGKNLHKAVKRLKKGKGTLALFNIESILDTSPRTKVDKEIHLYAWQVLVDEYRKRGMKKEAKKALGNYFSLLQEVLPDVSDTDSNKLEEVAKKLRKK
ncbi:hypothetical protein ACFL35_16450 [Candidatus Riflebacteria bacterium]